MICCAKEECALPPVLVAYKEIGFLGILIMNSCIDFPDTCGEAQVLNRLGEVQVYTVATDSPVLVICRKKQNKLVGVPGEAELLFIKAPERSV